MSRRLLVFVMFVLSASASLGDAQETKSNSEAHRQLEKISYRLGHWQAETTAPNGDYILAELNFEWALNKNAIVGTYSGRGDAGKIDAKMVTVWDATEKKIKTWWFDATGSVVVSVYKGQEEGKHVWESDWLVGGANGTGIKKATFIEDPDGQAFTLETTSGETIMAWRNWRKVSSFRFPQTETDYVSLFPSNYEQVKPLEHRLGDYVGTFEMHAPKMKAGIEMSVNWSLNKNFLEYHYSSAVLGDAFGITGWNPATKSFQNWTFMPDGGFGVATETLNKDGTSSSKGTFTGPDGTVETSNSGGPSADGSVTVNGLKDGKPAWTMNFRLRE